MQVHALFFARLPDLDAVKTRLAATIGPQRALLVHRWLTQRQVRALQEARLPFEFWVTPACRLEEARVFVPGASAYHDQVEGDLGQRLAFAANAAFGAAAQDEATRNGVLLIGSDCPFLDAQALLALAAEVQAGRFALMPAEDGGYVALGLPRPCPDLFREMPWSTPRLTERTLQVLFRNAAADEIKVFSKKLDCDENDDLNKIRVAFPELHALLETEDQSGDMLKSRNLIPHP
jgi:uncharacterized protein